MLAGCPLESWEEYQGVSYREAHVCELFDQPAHDPGLILFARCLHALEQSGQRKSAGLTFTVF